MSLQDLENLAPVLPPDTEESTNEHIPLEHALMLATPQDQPVPAATIGMAYGSNAEMPPSPINPYEHLASRGSNLNAQNLNPNFASRLSRALMDAESATGERAVLRDLYRPPERQAQYYANYTQRPVVFGGHTYQPGEKGGLAAPPGQSYHGAGEAADVQRGRILDYLHRYANNYGLEFLKGTAFSKDPVHIQLAGGRGEQAPAQAQDISGNDVSQAATDRAVPSDAPFAPSADEARPLPDDSNLADELATMRDYLDTVDKQKKLTAAAPLPVDDYTPVPPVVPPSIMPDLSSLTHTVIGADGQLQTIHAGDASIDPTVGMTQGIMASPEMRAKITAGDTVDYSNFVTNADQQNAASMTHGPVDQQSLADVIKPYGAGGQAAGFVAGLPYSLVTGPYRGMESLGRQAAEIPPGQSEQDVEQAGAGISTALGLLGARLPMVVPGELGATGGRMRGAGGRFVAQPPASPATPGPVVASQSVRDLHFTVPDYFRMADDQNAPLVRMATRAGAPPQMVHELRDTMRVNTGATSQAIADAAATIGEAATPGFRFSVRTPVPEIRRWALENDMQGFSDYMNLYDTLDDVRIQTNLNANTPVPRPGPIMVRGETEVSALNALRNFEQANPQFAAARQRFHENVMEARRFASNGEYATISPAELASLNTTRPHEVFWADRSRVTDPSNIDATGRPTVRADIFDQLGKQVTEFVRRRINNEAVGRYVDFILQSPIGRNFFQRVTPEQLRTHPQMRNREVSFERRGVTEHYVARSRTVADLLKQDPYYFSSGAVAEVLGAPRRLFQATTTSLLAPWFAATDTLRNYVISQGTVAGANRGYRPFAGLKPPGLVGLRQSLTGAGIPMGRGTIPWAITSQLIPKLSKHVALTFESNSANWLRTLVGNQTMNNLTTVLSRVYADSLVRQVESMGAHSGSYFGKSADNYTALNRSQAMLALNRGIARLESNPAMFQIAGLLRGYRNLLAATHNATQFAFIQRNLGRAPVSRLAAEARELTGNPLVQGRYTTPNRRIIRYDSPDMTIPRAVGGAAGHAWALANEIGRGGVPWHNMTTQGIKRFGQAAVANPAEAYMRAITYYIGVPALSYYLAASMGKDPNGNSYVDHMMRRRDEYRQSMNIYIPIKDRLAEDGIEFPWFQEGVLTKRMTEAALNHLYGNSVHTMSEDFKAALSSALDITMPPMHPVISTVQASQGQAPTQNWGGVIAQPLGGVMGIGGEPYQRSVDPFDSNKAVSPIIENVTRALAPSIADIGLGGWAAMSHSEPGLTNSLGALFKQGGKVAVTRTPILRDIANLHTPLSGNTRERAEMFRREKDIEQLDTFYQRFGLTGQQMIGRAKPLSRSGEEYATSLESQGLPGHPPPEPPGLPRAKPTNPLYVEFAKMLYDRTKHDSVRTGGEGFRSIWDRYREYSTTLNTMRDVDYGNMVTWANRIMEKPTQMRELANAHVDPFSPYAVRNYYERKREDVTRIINKEITRLESDMSAKYGKPIKIGDLHPYSVPGQTQQAVPGAENTPPWNLEGQQP